MNDFITREEAMAMVDEAIAALAPDVFAAGYEKGYEDALAGVPRVEFLPDDIT